MSSSTSSHSGRPPSFPSQSEVVAKGTAATSAQREFEEIKTQLAELQALYERYFPKVDPRLVQELVSNTDSSHDSKDRLYSLNVIVKEGTDPDRAREYFLSRTGQAPTSLEGGRHYVVNVYLTLDLVKELQSLDAVEHIRGDYTFDSWAMHSAHMHRGEDEQSRIREA